MLRLSKVDELIISDHSYLDSSDNCYFLREYIPRVGFSGGETNSLISNFKKSMDRKGRSEWSHKERAIKQLAKEFANALNPAWLKIATLVPIPPSKTKNNPLYDDRMTQVLRLIGGYRGLDCDVRELIIQTVDMAAAHTTEERPHPGEIECNYLIDESIATPEPKTIGLFDDILTTGAHFRAAKNLLMNRFPTVPITGIFVARRIIPPIDWDQGNL